MLHRNELFGDTESGVQKLENHNQLMKLGGGGPAIFFESLLRGPTPCVAHCQIVTKKMNISGPCDHVLGPIRTALAANR